MLTKNFADFSVGRDSKFFVTKKLKILRIVSLPGQGSLHDRNDFPRNCGATAAILIGGNYRDCSSLYRENRALQINTKLFRPILMRVHA